MSSVMVAPDVGSCEEFAKPPVWDTIINSVLLIGVAGSYIPQQIRIVRRRTAEGISNGYLAIGTLSATFAFINIVLLSRTILACCSELSAGSCYSNSLGVDQVFAQFVMFGFTHFLAVIYWPRDPHPAYKAAFRTGIACFIMFVLSGSIGLYATHNLSPKFTDGYATAMGLLSAALAAIQYLPQIYTTYLLGHAGSLSIPTMLIQTPGAIIWAVSLAQRPGTNWSSWLPYVTAAVCQGIILAMCIRAEFFKPRPKHNFNNNTLQDEEGIEEPLRERAEEGIEDRTPMII